MYITFYPFGSPNLRGRSNPDGSIKTFTYDRFERTEINELGNETTYLSNSLKQTLKITNAQSEVTEYIYDPAGNLIEILHPENLITEMRYDEQGRLILVKDPSAGSVSKKYNSLDLIYETQDASGMVTQFEFDALARKVGKKHIRLGSQIEYTSWEFDTAEYGIGNLASVTKGSFTEKYTYDEKSRLSNTTRIFGGESYSEYLSYDSISRVNSREFPSGERVSYKFSEFGGLVSIVDDSTDQPIWQGLENNADGALTKIKLGGAISLSSDYHLESGLISSINATSSSGERIQDLSFDFDSLGSLIQRSDNIGSHMENFEYDSLNRLIASHSSLGKSEYYSYDILGNLIEKSSPTGVKRFTYQSDCSALSNGYRLCSQLNSPSDGKEIKIEYSYDILGRVTTDSQRSYGYSLSGKVNSIYSPEAITNFSYGPNNQRYERTDTRAGKTSITRYLGGGSELVEEDGRLKWRTQLAPGVLAIKIDEKRFLHFQLVNHIGNVVLTTDESGKVLERFDYDPWGKKRKDSFESLEVLGRSSLRGFTGHEQIDTHGLVHMNGRVYSPEMSRFLSPDNFVQDPYNLQSLNRYSYVWNNPLTNTDPTGYFSIGGLVGGLINLVS